MRLPPRPNRFHGQARFIDAEWLRDDSITERERRRSSLVLTHSETSPCLVSHVESAAVSFRRDEDEIAGMLIDDVCEIRAHLHMCVTTNELRLSKVVNTRHGL